MAKDFLDTQTGGEGETIQAENKNNIPSENYVSDIKPQEVTTEEPVDKVEANEPPPVATVPTEEESIALQKKDELPPIPFALESTDNNADWRRTSPYVESDIIDTFNGVVNPEYLKPSNLIDEPFDVVIGEDEGFAVSDEEKAKIELENEINSEGFAVGDEEIGTLNPIPLGMGIEEFKKQEREIKDKYPNHNVSIDVKGNVVATPKATDVNVSQKVESNGVAYKKNNPFGFIQDERLELDRTDVPDISFDKNLLGSGNTQYFYGLFNLGDEVIEQMTNFGVQDDSKQADKLAEYFSDKAYLQKDGFFNVTEDNWMDIDVDIMPSLVDGLNEYNYKDKTYENVRAYAERAKRTYESNYAPKKIDAAPVQQKSAVKVFESKLKSDIEKLKTTSYRKYTAFSGDVKEIPLEPLVTYIDTEYRALVREAIAGGDVIPKQMLMRKQKSLGIPTGTGSLYAPIDELSQRVFTQELNKYYSDPKNGGDYLSYSGHSIESQQIIRDEKKKMIEAQKNAVKTVLPKYQKNLTDWESKNKKELETKISKVTTQADEVLKSIIADLAVSNESVASLNKEYQAKLSTEKDPKVKSEIMKEYTSKLESIPELKKAINERNNAVSVFSNEAMATYMSAYSKFSRDNYINATNEFNNSLLLKSKEIYRNSSANGKLNVHQDADALVKTKEFKKLSYDDKRRAILGAWDKEAKVLKSYLLGKDKYFPKAGEEALPFHQWTGRRPKTADEIREDKKNLNNHIGRQAKERFLFYATDDLLHPENGQPTVYGIKSLAKDELAKVNDMLALKQKGQAPMNEQDMLKWANARDYWQKVLEHPDTDESWFYDLGDGIKNSIKVPFVSNIMGIGKSTRLADAASNYAQGNMSMADIQLVTAYSSLNKLNELKPISAAREIGASLGETVNFMAEIMLTGGAFKAGQQMGYVATKKALEGSVKLVSSFSDDAGVYLAGKIADPAFVGKINGIVGALSGGLAQSLVLPSTPLKVVDRFLPHIATVHSGAYDDIIVAIEQNSETSLESILKGVGVSWAEMVVERFGGHLAMGATKKALLQDMASSQFLRRSAVGYWIRNKAFKSMDELSDYVSKNNINMDGIAPEMIEEFIQMNVDAIITGDRTIAETNTAENLGKMAISVGLFGGIMNGAKWTSVKVFDKKTGNALIETTDVDGKKAQFPIESNLWKRFNAFLGTKDLDASKVEQFFEANKVEEKDANVLFNIYAKVNGAKLTQDATYQQTKEEFEKEQDEVIDDSFLTDGTVVVIEEKAEEKTEEEGSKVSESEVVAKNVSTDEDVDTFIPVEKETTDVVVDNVQEDTEVVDGEQATENVFEWVISENGVPVVENVVEEENSNREYEVVELENGVKLIKTGNPEIDEFELREEDLYNDNQLNPVIQYFNNRIKSIEEDIEEENDRGLIDKVANKLFNKGSKNYKEKRAKKLKNLKNAKSFFESYLSENDNSLNGREIRIKSETDKKIEEVRNFYFEKQYGTDSPSITDEEWLNLQEEKKAKIKELEETRDSKLEELRKETEAADNKTQEETDAVNKMVDDLFGTPTEVKAEEKVVEPAVIPMVEESKVEEPTPTESESLTETAQVTEKQEDTKEETKPTSLGKFQGIYNGKEGGVYEVVSRTKATVTSKDGTGKVVTNNISKRDGREYFVRNGNTVYLDTPIEVKKKEIVVEAPVVEPIEAENKPKGQSRFLSDNFPKKTSSPDARVMAEQLDGIDEKTLTGNDKINMLYPIEVNGVLTNKPIITALRTLLDRKKITETEHNVLKAKAEKIIEAKAKAKAVGVSEEQVQKEEKKKKVNDFFDGLKIDTRGKALALPLPLIPIYNSIVELAKKLALGGMEFSEALSQAKKQIFKERIDDGTITFSDSKAIEKHLSFTGRLLTYQAKTKAIIQDLDAYVSAKRGKAKDDILKKFESRYNVADVKQALTKFIKENVDPNLQKTQLGKLLKAVAKADDLKTLATQMKAVNNVIEEQQEVIRQSILDKIMDIIKKPKSYISKSVNDKDKAKVSLDAMRELQNYINSLDTNQLSSMSQSSLESILDDINDIIETGRIERKAEELAEEIKKSEKRAIAYQQIYETTSKNRKSGTIIGEDEILDYLDKKKGVLIIDGLLVTNKSEYDRLTPNTDIATSFDTGGITTKNIKANEANGKNPIRTYLSLAGIRDLKGLMMGMFKNAPLLRKMAEKTLSDLHFAYVKRLDEIHQLNKKHFVERNKIFGSRKKAILRLGTPIEEQGIVEGLDVITPDHVIYYYNLAQVGVEAKDGVIEGRRKLVNSGVDMDMIDNYMNRPENADLKKYADYLIDEFYPSMKESFNETYYSITGMNLPDGKYVPQYSENMDDLSANFDEFFNPDVVAQATAMSNRMKDKINNPTGKVNVATTSTRVLEDYIKSMSHAKHFIPIAKDLATFINPNTSPLIIEKIGEKAYDIMKENLDIIINDRTPFFNIKGQKVNKGYNMLMNYNTFVTLAVKLSSIPKQAVAFINSYYQGINDGIYPHDVMFQQGRFLSFATLSQNERKLLSELLGGAFMAERFKGGNIDLETRRLIQEIESSTAKKGKDLLAKIMMSPIAMGDYASVFLGDVPLALAYYNKGKRRGMNHDEAFEFAYKAFTRSVDESKQSTKSNLTTAFQRDPNYRLFNTFKTAQTQAANKTMTSLQRLFNYKNLGLSKNEILQDINNIGGYLMGQAAFSMISSALLSEVLTGEAGDDEKKRFAYDTVLETLQSSIDGYGLAGLVTNTVVNGFTGNEWKNNTPVIKFLHEIAVGGIERASEVAFTDTEWDDLTESEQKEIWDATPVRNIMKQVDGWKEYAKGDKELWDAIMGHRDFKSKKVREDKLFELIFDEPYQRKLMKRKKSSSYDSDLDLDLDLDLELE